MERHNLEWLYYKIYVGEAYHGLDALAVDLLPVICSNLDARSWFFLRYYDHFGPHLRFRIQAAPDAIESIAERVRLVSEAVLRDLPFTPSSGYNPMIAPDEIASVAPLTSNRFVTGLERSVYEPEHDIYGGADVIDIAHDVFAVSSDLAVRVLDAERRGVLSRKTIAPCLMECARNAMPSQTSATDMWRDYALHWLGGDAPATRGWRTRFAEKAAQLALARVPIVLSQTDSDDGTQALVREWTDCLRGASARYVAGGAGSRMLNVLRFNFCHLMNNRIGISAVEEAYLATLLEEYSRSAAAA